MKPEEKPSRPSTLICGKWNAVPQDFRRRFICPARVSFFRRAALVLAAWLIALSTYAVEILDDPVFRFLAPHQVEISWQTDVPSDSRVDYAINPPAILTISNAAPVTQHVVVIPNLQPGQPYNFFISSTVAGQTAETGDFLFVRAAPVGIQEPVRAQPGDLPPLVSGVVRIIVGTAHPSIQIQSVTFLYVPPGGGQPLSIGVDTNGAGVIANTFEDAVTGDGWSIAWNTAGLPEGPYQLIAQVTTSIGQFPAMSDVILDHQPPQPVLLAPLMGNSVRSNVLLHAEGGQGNVARFEFQGPVEAVLSYNPTGLAQTNFPFDGRGGRMMCDPTSEASILLSLPAFREKLLANPAFQKALAKCMKTNSSMEDCIRRIVIRTLAKVKGTSAEGTTRQGEIDGSNGFLQALRLPWRYERKKDHNEDNESYTVAELKACASKEGVLGVMVHIHPCGNINATGHAMALKSINDKTNSDGTFTVTFMDPARGSDVAFNVSANGSFTYTHPSGTSGLMCIKSIGMFLQPAPEQRLTEGDWQLIGSDGNGTNGWDTVWNPAGLPSGFYWLRVVLTDEHARSGEDLVEVFLTPPSLTLRHNGDNVVARWSTNASNYKLEFTTNMLAPDWLPVTTSIVVEDGDNTVPIAISGTAQFLRLREE